MEDKVKRFTSRSIIQNYLKMEKDKKRFYLNVRSKAEKMVSKERPYVEDERIDLRIETYVLIANDGVLSAGLVE